MVKKLWRIPLLLGILLLLFNSCRVDDPVSEQQSTSKEKIAAFERFEKANNSNQPAPGTAEKKSYISYAEPFAHIISSFLKKHPEYEEKLHEQIGTIRLDVSSQTFGEKAKIVVFPVTENNSTQVIGSWVGRVNPERTWVDFVYLHGGSEDSQAFINTFQQYYNGKNKTANANTAARYGDPYHQEIPDVTIIKMNPWGHSGGDGGVDDWTRYMDEHPYENGHFDTMNGDSTRHDDGGTYNTFQPAQNPCEQTKSIVNNAKSKPAIDALKTQSKQNSEDGYKFKADGTPSQVIHGGEHSVSFGDKSGYEGAYHNHTSRGIPMLSPPDIDQLLGFARAQPSSNSANVNNAFMGMVAPNGMHYLATFGGTYQDAVKTFSQDDLDNYTTDFSKLENDLTDETKNGMTYMDGNGNITNKGVEKLFFETLKKMGLEGKVNLQRIEADDTVKTINLNANNDPIPTTC
ncbi:hypothetical protein [Chryseobacterium sp.]|uniref:hypothetical protein n=1 Tax=Chryseobacterium sp. TaxID=1871047 RepID=UPI0025B7BA62|nr:hypothetical protein [Chryseobacterium sp.]MBV8326783.1 hypothetical protein [Chryseobacterium sp.]